MESLVPQAAQVLNAPSPLFTRTGRRVAVSLAARVRYAGLREAAAMIVNISSYGVRAQCPVDSAAAISSR